MAHVLMHAWSAGCLPKWRLPLRCSVCTRLHTLLQPYGLQLSPGRVHRLSGPAPSHKALDLAHLQRLALGTWAALFSVH